MNKNEVISREKGASRRQLRTMCKVLAGKMLNSKEVTVCDLGWGIDREIMDGTDFPVFIPNTVSCTTEMDIHVLGSP